MNRKTVAFYAGPGSVQRSQPLLLLLKRMGGRCWAKPTGNAPEHDVTKVQWGMMVTHEYSEARVVELLLVATDCSAASKCHIFSLTQG